MEADYKFVVYTITNSEVVRCGTISGNHAGLYINGEFGIIKYEGHMDNYYINRYTLEENILIEEVIAEGSVDPRVGETYPELAEYGYGTYNEILWFCDVSSPVVLYQSIE